MPSKSSCLKYIPLALGAAFSVLMVVLNPKLFFLEDQLTFWVWLRDLSVGWREIYLNCDSCNYPILGLLSSTGVLSLVAVGGMEKAAVPFRLYMAAVDGINILLLYLLFRQLGVKRAELFAGLIGVLPSNWVGGALWGQIDSISQFFLLATLLWASLYLAGGGAGRINPVGFYAGYGVLMGLQILTKQLAVFNLFSLSLLLVYTVLNDSCRVHSAGRRMTAGFLAAGGAFAATVFIPDLFLKLRRPFFSHLYFIFRSGSYHFNYLAWNGTNIWIFGGQDMLSSSRLFFFSGQKALSLWQTVFTPFGMGMILLGFYCAFISLSLGLFLWRGRVGGDVPQPREVLVNFVLHLSLVNLAFNVLLTGTHERYLFHFYPMILLAWAGLRKFHEAFSKKMLSLLLGGSLVYGGFVYMVLCGRIDHYGMAPHYIVGVVNLLLLIYLTITAFRYQRLAQNLSWLRGRRGYMTL